MTAPRHPLLRGRDEGGILEICRPREQKSVVAPRCTGEELHSVAVLAEVHELCHVVDGREVYAVECAGNVPHRRAVWWRPEVDPHAGGQGMHDTFNWIGT